MTRKSFLSCALVCSGRPRFGRRISCPISSPESNISFNSCRRIDHDSLARGFSRGVREGFDAPCLGMGCKRTVQPPIRVVSVWNSQQRSTGMTKQATREEEIQRGEYALMALIAGLVVAWGVIVAFARSTASPLGVVGVASMAAAAAVLTGIF